MKTIALFAFRLLSVAAVSAKTTSVQFDDKIKEGRAILNGDLVIISAISAPIQESIKDQLHDLVLLSQSLGSAGAANAKSIGLLDDFPVSVANKAVSHILQEAIKQIVVDLTASSNLGIGIIVGTLRGGVEGSLWALSELEKTKRETSDETALKNALERLTVLVDGFEPLLSDQIAAATDGFSARMREHITNLKSGLNIATATNTARLTEIVSVALF